MAFDPDAYLASIGVQNPVVPPTVDQSTATTFDPDEYLATQPAEASTFATPSDLANYAKHHSLATGDNGIGAWGAVTASTTDPMVALPRDVLAAHFGDEDAANGAQVEVMGANGPFLARIADKMPATQNIKNGANIDLNPAAAIMAGHPGGVTPVRYRFVDPPISSTTDGGDAMGGGANASTDSISAPPDTVTVSNDGGALDRAIASVQGDAAPLSPVASGPATAGNVTPPATSGFDPDAYLASRGVANPVAPSATGNPFAVPLPPQSAGAPATDNIAAAGNPFVVPSTASPAPSDQLADTFTPAGRAFLDSLVQPNPALMPPDTSIGHQAANAMREAGGGAEKGGLEMAEGFERAMAGQEAGVTPQSVAAGVDNQIAQRQSALDQLNALPPEKQTDDIQRTKDTIQGELVRLQAQKADLTTALPPGSTPDLLTPEGQAARDARNAPANTEADHLRQLAQQADTALGQDVGLKDTALAGFARGAGGALPLMAASALPGGELLAAGAAGLQAKAGAYDEYYSEAKARGESDEDAQQEAQQYSDAAALRTIPEMAAFLGSGKVAAGVVNKLLSPDAPAALRFLVAGAASTAANAAAGTVNQAAEQIATGKPLDLSYSVERLGADAMFGGLHAFGEMSHAPSAPVSTDENANAGQTTGTASDSLRQDAASAQGAADAVRATPGTTSTAPDTSADASTPPVYASGDTPQARAESFLSSTPDQPVTAAQFDPDEDVPATLSRFPRVDLPDGSSVVYDPAAHDPQDFTAPQNQEIGTPPALVGVRAGDTFVDRQGNRHNVASVDDDGTVNTTEDPSNPGYVGMESKFSPDAINNLVANGGSIERASATPGDTSTSTTGTASTANAATDAQRASRGLAPAEASAQRDFGQVWDQAKAKLQNDPTAGQRLVDELKAKPRPVSDTENALLLHTQIGAQAEHDAAVQAVNTAPDDAARASAQTRLARATDNLTDIYDAGRKAGTESGRGLNARKMLANQDYSLGNMLARRQAAEGGKPLTTDQQAQVRAAHEKVADAKAKADAHAAMVDDVDSAMNGAPPTSGDPDWSVGGNQADAEAQHRTDLKQQAREGIDRAGGVELLDAVREAGGLPTDDPSYRGELQTIREAHAPVPQAGRTGTFNLFRNDAPKLDELTSRLRARGFDVQTPDDALNLIYGRLTDKQPVYGFPAREDAQSGMASSDAYFRRQPSTPPRTPEELRPLQQKWQGMLQALSPKTALRLEIVKQDALDAMWNGQNRPVADDGSSPHAAYLDGAVYLSHEALKANSDQLNRVNFLHELTHHFERALPIADRMRLEDQWKQEMASGESPLHNLDGTPRADVDPRAFDTSSPKNFPEWLAERVAWDNEQHFAGKIDTALNGTPTARLAARIRDFVGRVWKTLRPGMTGDDANAKFREWLGRGARVDDTGRGAQAAVRPRTDYVQAVRDFFAGRLATNAVLEMGRPGEILRRAGLENLPIRLSQRVLRRKTGKHPELSQQLIEQLPDLINKPTMVYDTPGDPTGKGVITSKQYGDGKTLTVFANLKVDGDRAVVYNVKSLYGKVPDELLRELHQSPRIGYADPEKAPAWVRQSASQAREPFQHLPTLLDKVDRATQGGGSQDEEPRAAVRRTLVEQGYHPASDDERKALGIPPAWADVHVADDPNAARIAVGKDSKGRTQSRYSTAHTSEAQAQKFTRLQQFNDALPGVMDRVNDSLATGHGEEEAAVLRLIHQTGFRNGGDEDTGGAVKAYGASNLRAEHVRFDGDTTHFDFTGKLGVRQQHSLTDPEITADLRERAADGGALFNTTDARVRDYLKQSGDFKVHDFRTWNATDLAAREVANRPAPSTPDEFWNERDRIGDLAAKKLGDTRKIALESYVNPAVFEPWKSSLGITDESRPVKRAKAQAEQAENPTAVGRGAGTPRADAEPLRDDQLPGRPAAGDETPAAVRPTGGVDPLAERMRQQRNQAVRDALLQEHDPAAAAKASLLADHAQRDQTIRDSLSPQSDLYDRMAALRRGGDDSTPQFAARRPLTDAERLDRAKQSLARRRDELLRRVATGDLTPRSRTRVNLDAEGQRLQAEHARAKQAFDVAVEKARQANRPVARKVADAFVKWNRAFKLSSPFTLAKLFAAGVTRTVTTPIEEGIGGVYSKLLPKVAAAAPREGGINVRAESKALTEGLVNGIKQMGSIARTGRSEHDVLYGMKDKVPRSAADFFGAVHSAIKSPFKEAEFSRALEKRTTHAITNGVDVHDSLVQTHLMAQAYQDANRAIFMQPNFVSEEWNKALRSLESRPTQSGRAFYTAKALRFLLPVVKVPTNVIGETMSHVAGVPIGALKLAQVMHRGLSTIRPEEADMILRNLKKGSLGAGLMALGYMNPQAVGGFYQPGKRDPKDVKAGGVRIMGQNIPAWLMHAPGFLAMQVGATVRRVSDQYLAGGGQKGLMAGTKAGLLGLLDEVPFVDAISRLDKLKDAGARGDKAADDLVRNTVVPLGVQNAATYFDKHTPDGDPVKRNPTTLLENVESGIPGLRQNVPYDTRGLDAQTVRSVMSPEERAATLQQMMKQEDDRRRARQANTASAVRQDNKQKKNDLVAALRGEN